MNEAPRDWLHVRRGAAPLILSVPHAGTILAPLETRFVSPWLARKDVDWRIDELYDFAADRDATIVRTALARSLIDVNRDPSGASLYPGQATTEMCPTTTFDGEPLYRSGEVPDAAEITERRRLWFDPYHAALSEQIARLRARHERVVLYDAHSIRSRIPRLFAGELPLFNLGTNSGASCAPELRAAIAAILSGSGESFVVDGRFKGGFVTRAFGRPAAGVHAVQMELACRAYLQEPANVDARNWPAPFDNARAEKTRATLHDIFDALLDWAGSSR
jgi:N-formylglutamate deformylase